MQQTDSHLLYNLQYKIITTSYTASMFQINNCSLVFDEMSIQRNVQFNGKTFTGGIGKLHLIFVP